MSRMMQIRITTPITTFSMNGAVAKAILSLSIFYLVKEFNKNEIARSIYYAGRKIFRKQKCNVKFE
jgi:hypothetical protein